MNKTISLVFAMLIVSIGSALATTCPAGTVKGVLFDTVTVNPTGAEFSSDPLLNGKTYLVEASGTYTFAPSWSPDAGIADAGYSLRRPGYNNPNPTSTWIDGAVFSSPYQNWLELWINNAAVNWGVFTPSHTYSTVVTGTGNALKFKILDDVYSDNNGSLSVNIYTCDIVNTDTDNDGVMDNADMCPNTVKDVPTVKLNVNRWIWDNGWKTNLPKGVGNKFKPTMDYTYGCSCTQILDELEDKYGSVMLGHRKFGCSKSVLEEWHAMGGTVTPPPTEPPVEPPITPKLGCDALLPLFQQLQQLKLNCSSMGGCR